MNQNIKDNIKLFYYQLFINYPTDPPSVGHGNGHGTESNSVGNIRGAHGT